MKIAFTICLLAFAHIIYMTYLIYFSLPDETRTNEEKLESKKSELIYSNDGKYLVSVDYKSNNIKIINIEKEKEIKNLKIESGINSVLLNKIGKTIAVIGKDNKIRLYNYE